MPQRILELGGMGSRQRARAPVCNGTGRSTCPCHPEKRSLQRAAYHLPMLESIDHVNLVVRDLEGMADFYVRLLGMKITKQVTISGPWIDRTVGLVGVNADVIYLDLPQGPRVELIRYNSPPGKDSPEPGKSNTTGLRHLAFRVSDIDAVVKTLHNAGVKFFSDIQLVPDSQVTYAGGLRKRLAYFHDPEGNLLELCEYKEQRDRKE